MVWYTIDIMSCIVRLSSYRTSQKIQHSPPDCLAAMSGCLYYYGVLTSNTLRLQDVNIVNVSHITYYILVHVGLVHFIETTY